MLAELDKIKDEVPEFVIKLYHILEVFCPSNIEAWISKLHYMGQLKHWSTHQTAEKDGRQGLALLFQTQASLVIYQAAEYVQIYQSQ